MTQQKQKHAVIHAIAYLSIVGGLITLLWSLVLLHTSLGQQSWPTATIISIETGMYYQAGEQRYPLNREHYGAYPKTQTLFFDPDNPQYHVLNISNFWWHLYLSMAGLIVFYAGLHLRQERDRNIQSLGFE
jgi:hypothetical protein